MVGVVFSGMQWSPGRSPHPQLLDVAWCSAAVVVVVAWWSCSCGGAVSVV